MQLIIQRLKVELRKSQNTGRVSLEVTQKILYVLALTIHVRKGERSISLRIATHGISQSTWVRTSGQVVLTISWKRAFHRLAIKKRFVRLV